MSVYKVSINHNISKYFRARESRSSSNFRTIKYITKGFYYTCILFFTIIF